MLNKVLEQLDLKDLESLVQNSVSEGKSIEYKLSLPGNSDKDKKEFLADVSSFANTLGGDLIFGIKEEKGVAKNIAGVFISDIDAEIRKYDNLIRDGIEPRIQVAIRPIPVNENKIILIMRINKSWTGPHRVKFQDMINFMQETQLANML
jgi:predicted HTH transcriptional regulator